MKTLSVVIPVYFNEGSLPPLFVKLKEVEAALAQQSVALELIFVDDGSGDNSFAELLKIKEQRAATKVIKLTRNFGAIRALKAGMEHITGDCFVFLAADLQDPPELILEMLGHWLAGSQLVIAVRESREDPWHTKFFAAVYYWLLHRFVLPGFPSGGFDIALMDRVILQPLLNSSKSMYIPLLVYWLGYKPVVVSYKRLKREHGRSRWTFAKKFTAFLDVMLGFSPTPIRFISGVGVVVSALSFSYGVLVVINAMLGNVHQAGFASIIALITFLLGLIIIMLGVIGEYLLRLSNEANKRPEFVVEKVY